MAICTEWVPPNHATFQVANVFLAFTYMVPDNLIGLFMLRFFLAMAGLFFAVWAMTVICAPDTIIWNVVFCIVNIGHVIYLLISMRPIRFNAQHEEIYKAMFEPIGVRRYQYKSLADSGKVVELKTNDVYATEQVSYAKRVSVMLEGRCDIKRQNVHVSSAVPFEFLDSPEWVAGNDEKHKKVYFDVTISAVVDSIVISWNRDELLKILKKQIYLKNIFDSIVGKDISRKLFKSNKAITMTREPVETDGLTQMDYGGCNIFPIKENEKSESSFYTKVMGTTV